MSDDSGVRNLSDGSAVMPREDGPYVLRPLLDKVPLSEDGSRTDIEINCVEYFDKNLYVGTSASELLHFVQIPPDPADKSGKPDWILASRLSPEYSPPADVQKSQLPGIQQILLLPRVGRAWILCNWSATFYSLPEFTPVSPVPLVKNCLWTGGVDLNEPTDDEGSGLQNDSGVTMLLSLRTKTRVIGVKETPSRSKEIGFRGCILSVRRDAIACVADSKSYALLDVNQQLQIPLMNISSLEEVSEPSEIGHAHSIAITNTDGIRRSSSSVQNRPTPNVQGHSRSTSLGGAILGSMRGQNQITESDGSLLRQPSPNFLSTSPQSARDPSPTPSIDKPLPSPPESVAPDKKPEQPSLAYLKPHIVSPSPEEFLVVTGTSPSEPGVGVFINLDGEMTRSTVQFGSYPLQVAVDGTSSDMNASRSGLPDEEDGYVLASLARQDGESISYGLEVQRWDAGSEPHPEKHWLQPNGNGVSTAPYGIRSTVGSENTQFDEIIGKLSLKKFMPFPGPQDLSLSLNRTDSRTALSIERLSKEKDLFERNLDSQDEDSLPDEWEATRNAEGEEFARRLAHVETKLAVWSGSRIWWAIRNPLIIKIDTALEKACSQGLANPQSIDRRSVLVALANIRGRDPKTELEFMTFGYLRQKAGFLLFTSLVLSPTTQQFSDGEMHALEEVLMDSKLDPRVVLSLVPGVRNEVVQGTRGIWVYGGVKNAVEPFLRADVFHVTAKDAAGGLRPKLLHFLRRYLALWRKMKGFGSVPDENEVFRTVEAALLLVLLELDRASPNPSSAVRTELNKLVDKGVDCFERAVDLLESHHRLYILSRLYQSRQMSGDVLATWRRIIDGEKDDVPEYGDLELQVRRYLTKISSQKLVREYGVWLANRNPKLGVQVFAEDKGKAPKFEPEQAMEILRAEAPNAVKFYLEHLVFGKGHAHYVNELITYYLDIVIGDLESSADSREAVMTAYAAYRALQAPKPTYHHFLTENAPRDDDVWQSRLRLLQLLGGPHNYDTDAISSRIANLSGDLLVPETIILAGRQRQHDDALRLLVHKLGDYDTAVSYCIHSGASIYYTLPNGRRPSSTSDDEGERIEAGGLPLRRRLFKTLLREFLAIEDASDRVEQTGALLERFGGMFDLDEVLAQVPDGWSVDVVAGFLVGALRRLVQERHEAMMTGALSGVQNLRVNYDLIKERDDKGPSIEAPN